MIAVDGLPDTTCDTTWTKNELDAASLSGISSPIIISTIPVPVNQFYGILEPIGICYRKGSQRRTSRLIRSWDRGDPHSSRHRHC